MYGVYPDMSLLGRWNVFSSASLIQDLILFIFSALMFLKTNIVEAYITIGGGAHGVVVIVVGNGLGDTSSNPGRDWLHFT